MYDHIGPKINSFGSRGHQMKNYRFHVDSFSFIAVFDMGDTKIKMTPPCWARRAGSEHVFFLPWRVNFKIRPQARSGQGQVVTEVGQYAYLSKRFGKPSRLASFARLYLHSVASYWRKTYCDFIWPQVTSLWPAIISCTWIITDGVWPWSWKNWVGLIGLCETVSIFTFPHGLIMGRSRNWPDLRTPG